MSKTIVDPQHDHPYSLDDELASEGCQNSILDHVSSSDSLPDVGEVTEEKISPNSIEALATSQQLAGDLIKIMLKLIKKQNKPWSQLTLEEQEETINALTFDVYKMANAAMRMIASKGRKIIVGELKQSVIKDTIQLTVTCPKSPEACAAMGMSSAGGPVAFILLEHEDILNIGDPISPDPDENELPLDEEGEPVNVQP